MSSSKFFIFGGGRWREVDLSDGRVDGWGRAKFVYTRRGKVHIAKTRAVLSGLRDNVARKDSSVQDGARLPYKRIIDLTNKTNQLEHEESHDHSHCCRHGSKNGCQSKKADESHTVNNKVQCILKADAGIQTSLPSQPHNRKRKRGSTSSDEIQLSKIITNAVIHSNDKSPKKSLSLKRRRPESDSDDNRKIRPKKIKSSPKSTTEKPRDFIRELRSKSTNVQEHSKPSLRSDNVTDTRLSKIINTKESETSDNENLTLTEYKKHIAGKTTQGSQEQCKELIIDEEDIDLLRKYLLKHSQEFDLYRFDFDDHYKKLCFLKINPLVNVERCPQIARMLRRDSQDSLSQKDFVTQLGLRSVSNVSSQKRYRMRNNRSKRVDRISTESESKENSVVSHFSKNSNDLKKHKLAKTSTPIIHSDTDSSVSLIRLQTNKMLRERNHDDQLQSNTNTNQKRLRSKATASIEVADVSNMQQNRTQDKYKKILRKQNNTNELESKDVKNSKDSRLEDSEEQFVPKKSERLINNSKHQNEDGKVSKTLESKESSQKSNKGKSIKSNQEQNRNSSQNGLRITEVKSLEVKSLHSRGYIREYSSLEDQAIVAWVSAGERARLVNGNRLWRQLQEHYPHLAGTQRSWHSLRNRYLRYILPSLGALALPPGHVARLRAAAATGELKTKKLKISRRNSIFAAPARGALSRKPTRLNTTVVSDENNDVSVIRDGSSTPSKGTAKPYTTPAKRSPRYSDITRRFAHKHRSENSTPTESPIHSPNREAKKKQPENGKQPNAKSITSSLKSLDTKSGPNSRTDSKRLVLNSNRSADASKKLIPNSNTSADASKKSIPNSKRSPDAKKSPPSSNQSHSGLSDDSNNSVKKSNVSSSQKSIQNTNKSRERNSSRKRKKANDSTSNESDSPVNFRRSLRNNTPNENTRVPRTRKLFNPAAGFQ